MSPSQQRSQQSKKAHTSGNKKPQRNEAGLHAPAKQTSSVALSRKRVSPTYAYVLLSVATVFCLAPFSGRAFHVDDTLFVWTAQHIVKQPLNPYGFDLIWDTSRVTMPEVTQNPPLAAYYSALLGKAGWSERTLHIGFMVPALIVVLGTYWLANRLSVSPLLAGFATLLAPGFLVSSLGVMCDIMMVALWMLAIIFWVKGEDDNKPVYFVAAGFLIGFSALSKYYGAALIPLLLVYSLVRRRRLRIWALSLLIPVVMLAIYNVWTANLYGQGLLTHASEFAQSQREFMHVSFLTNGLVATSFAGGCGMPALLFSFVLWTRKQFLAGIGLAAACAALILSGWIDLGLQVGGAGALAWRHQHWLLIGTQLALYIYGGIVILALAITDAWKNRDAESLLLMLWIMGTFVFAGFLNWTVNARSILPLIPAVGILLARRVDGLQWPADRKLISTAAVLAILGVISLWIAAGDTKLANTARQEARNLCESTRNHNGSLWFEGHWGFQYYMERCGARPVDFSYPEVQPGDRVVIPENNVELVEIPENVIASANTLEVKMPYGASTIRADMGAGFYSAAWGPLPFVIGPIPPERYKVIQVAGK